MIERESHHQTHLPPGFDSGHWPPLNVARDNLSHPTKITEKESLAHQGRPDLELASESSFPDDSVAARADGEGAGSEAAPMVEDVSNPSLALYKAKLLNSNSRDMVIEAEGEWELANEDVSIDRSGLVPKIRFPNLPLLYYHNGVLKSIAEAVGKVYKIDRNTSNYETGKYARFAVGLDLTKPLLPHIEIDGKDQRVEYEGLPKICFQCGTYGHIIQNCPDVHNVQMQPVHLMQQEAHSSIEGKNISGNMEIPSHRRSQKSGYGPWMFAETSGWKPAVGGQAQTAKQDKSLGKKINGSRFDILRDEDNMDAGKVDKNNRKDGGIAQKDKTIIDDICDNNNTCERGVEVDARRKTNNKGKTKVSHIFPIPPSVGKDVNLKKATRDPLGSIPQNGRMLDPSKHSVSIILDDKIHYGMPEPVYSFPSVGPATDKENIKRHDPNKGRPRGILLAQNVKKSLKVKKARTSSNSPHSDVVKTTILESLESGINVPIV